MALVGCPSCGRVSNEYTLRMTTRYFLDQNGVSMQQVDYTCPFCGLLSDHKKWTPIAPAAISIGVDPGYAVDTIQFVYWDGKWVNVDEEVVQRTVDKVLAKDDRFPHRCPRCQRRAYIGLNHVEHESGVVCSS